MADIDQDTESVHLVDQIFTEWTVEWSADLAVYFGYYGPRRKRCEELDVRKTSPYRIDVLEDPSRIAESVVAGMCEGHVPDAEGMHYP